MTRMQMALAALLLVCLVAWGVIEIQNRARAIEEQVKQQILQVKLEQLKMQALEEKARQSRALPVLSATTVGFMGSPLGQGPFLATSALAPGRT